MLKAIVFDFDGLILDTETPSYEAWNEIYARYGATLPRDKWTRIIGHGWHAFDPYAYLESQIGDDVDRVAIRSEKDRICHAMIEANPILPGVVDLLQEAKEQGLKLAVASSSKHAWVDGHLQRLGLMERFDVVSCSDDTGVAKPDPAVYLHACDRLGVAADHAVALEDSFNGLKAAKAAGLVTAVVPNEMTREMSFDQADIVLPTLAGVTVGQLDELLRFAIEVESQKLCG